MPSGRTGAVLVIMAIATSAGSSIAATSGSPGAQRIADRAHLRLGDLPAGWHALPNRTLDLSVSTCLARQTQAQATSEREFARGAHSQLKSIVGVFATLAQAKSVFNIQASARTWDCMATQAMNKAQVPSAKVAQHVFELNDAGAPSLGRELVVTVAGGGVPTVTGYVDLDLARKARSVVIVLSTNVFSRPLSVEQQSVALRQIVSRLPSR